MAKKCNFFLALWVIKFLPLEHNAKKPHLSGSLNFRNTFFGMTPYIQIIVCHLNLKLTIYFYPGEFDHSITNVLQAKEMADALEKSLVNDAGAFICTQVGFHSLIKYKEMMQTKRS